MKFFSYSLVFGLIFFCNCRKDDRLPECMQSKISDFSNNSCEFGATVKEYTFQGKKVYVFSMGFCGADLPVGIADQNCNSVGTLGGLIGNTKINGEEFSNAKYVRTVWSR